MNRRQFVLTAATFALLAGCGVLPNLGKPATPRVARVGILTGPQYNDALAGLKQGLAHLGYVDGQSIVFEQRDPGGNTRLLPELVSELIELPVDVIVAFGASAAAAARQATTVIPVVFAIVTDPVSQGLVASLAHPSRNLTGVTNAPATVSQKELQVLGQLVPNLSRVAIVFADTDSGAALRLEAITITAKAMGVQVMPLNIRSAEDVEPALAAALAWQAQAIMSFGGPGAVADAVPRLANFEMQNRIPVALTTRAQVQAGGLLSYGASFTGQGRTAANYVDKIIRGAIPADLPVEQPVVYELFVNQTIAQALGITIPQDLAVQVTEWVT